MKQRAAKSEQPIKPERCPSKNEMIERNVDSARLIELKLTPNLNEAWPESTNQTKSNPI